MSPIPPTPTEFRELLTRIGDSLSAKRLCSTFFTAIDERADLDAYLSVAKEHFGGVPSSTKRYRCRQIAQLVPVASGWRAALRSSLDADLDSYLGDPENIIEWADQLALEDVVRVVAIPAFGLVRSWDSDELLHGSSPPPGVYVWESVAPCINRTGYSTRGVVQFDPVDPDLLLAVIGPGELLPERTVRGLLAIDRFFEEDVRTSESAEEDVDAWGARVRVIEKHFALYSPYDD